MLTNRAIKTNDQVTREMSGGDWEEKMSISLRVKGIARSHRERYSSQQKNTPPASGEE